MHPLNNIFKYYFLFDRKWPNSAVAVPPGAADGQVVPALHQLDGGRLGVQAV